MVHTAASFASQPSHNLDLAMQKYLVLHSQHEELTQYLDVIRPPTRASTWSVAMMSSPTSCGTSPVSTPALSLSSSPTNSTFSLPSPRRSRTHVAQLPPPNVNAGSTSSLDTVWDEDVMCEVEAEEQRLSSVNEGIKRALTELLNCEAVRSDRSLRMWVQCRLMETEKELRSGRRKRSAAY
jgi:hypothetical protein